MIKYICQNLKVQTSKGLIACDREWDETVWNEEVDTEYTRNEKCPKCGSKDIKIIN